MWYPSNKVPLGCISNTQSFLASFAASQLAGEGGAASRPWPGIAFHLLTATVSWVLPDDPKISSYLNVKWGKVLINSVPTSIVEGHPHTHSPPTCWQVLIDNNPSLHYLKVCQLPLWVCCPSLFKPGLQSSLVLAFEDPDGTIAPSLIYACHVGRGTIFVYPSKTHTHGHGYGFLWVGVGVCSKKPMGYPCTSLGSSPYIAPVFFVRKKDLDKL